MTSLADVMRGLPAEVEWAVGFRLPRLLAVVGPRPLRGAFGLPTDIAVEDVRDVVLTSRGPLIDRGAGLEPYADGAPALPGAAGTLASRFDPLLTRVDDQADCVGLGQTQPARPVTMAVALDARGRGSADAWFADPPTRDGWHLLAAVGVRPLSPPRPLGRGGPWHVRFSYALTAHLDAAGHARYRRTANCNRFFLLGGVVDADLRAGLTRAARDRLAAGATDAYAAALTTAETIAGHDTLMTARSGRRVEPYGDLVPAALLLAGLTRPPGDRTLLERGLSAAAALRARLRAGQRDGGWPFQTDTVTTGLDSAIVLLGLPDDQAVAALERFRVRGVDAYSADRVGPPGPSTVRAAAATAHWQRGDLATTALARAWRRQAGLEQTTSLAWVSQRFDRRGSAFVACPWLLDWLLAVGLHDDPAPEADDLRGRLRDELLASRDQDGGFGRPGARLLATACACLALERLGVQGRTLALSQLALVDIANDERPATAVPFFSAARADLDTAAREHATRSLLHGGPVVCVDGALYALTVYEDRAGAVTAGLVARALARPADVDDDAGAAAPTAAAHPRYRCASTTRYVCEHALPGALAGP